MCMEVDRSQLTESRDVTRTVQLVQKFRKRDATRFSTVPYVLQKDRKLKLKKKLTLKKEHMDCLHTVVST